MIIKPFLCQTDLDHLNTEYVRYSDPYCISPGFTWAQPDLLCKIVSPVKCVINQVLEVVLTPGLEHEPGLEGIDLSAALDRHVAGVVAHVVEFVLLKKLIRRIV